ncbi:MAG: SlyX family protein [Candidatus Oceanisphaera merdipullorum]|nr:SlyX family protein [Candidatus Oceanisphaera merdipullorum]
MTNDILARLEQLETRLAFQDDTIEQLNQEITAQSAQTARLQAQLSMIAQRLKDLQPSNMGSQADEPPPPHY